MITILKNINIKEVEKDIAICYCENNPIIDELNEIFNNAIEDEKTTINTLGFIKAKNIYVYSGNDYEKAFKEISEKDNVVVILDTFAKEDNYQEVAEAFGEIITKNCYVFDQLKTTKEQAKSFAYYTEEGVEEYVEKGIKIGESINLAKTLINLPNNYLNAEKMAQYAINECGSLPNVTIEVLEEEDMKELKMGAFLGVSKGSYDKPKLIVIKYQGKETFEDPIAFVGKGLTFDTGGYSLKTSMVSMKSDMSGAAAVIGALKGIASLGLKENVYGIIGATDNRLSNNSTLPDDVLTAMNGKTIEIVSIDAEGRLVLADVLWYTQEKLGAKKVIDIATLTGSMVGTFGELYTGAYSNDQAFIDCFKQVSEQTKEHIWQMPLNKEYFKGLKSTVADFKNSGPRVAGANVSAMFLKQFIKDETSWIHLDIAGTSFINSLGTGVMTKTFIKFCE